ncbi:MAG: gamma carbonic anhydrase family protein [Desulfobacterales bacterium]|jgi:carbonic anhydrase/acetyltransferase-like protein (isoleucine patch superfamily)|nr:gamma carbonic anhydrase family protein [Desulfobacterales bacterium]
MLYRFDGKQPIVGETSYVSELASVIGEVIIGEHCYIGHGAILRGDYSRIEIGDGTSVEEGAVIHAPPNEVNRIGNHVTIGHGVMAHGKSIGDHALIGMGAVISVWSELGEWVAIGEGTVVKRGQIIASGMVAAGNPARIIRELAQRDKEVSIKHNQLYMDTAKKYLRYGLEPVKARE